MNLRVPLASPGSGLSTGFTPESAPSSSPFTRERSLVRTQPRPCRHVARLEEAPFLGDTWFYRALSALGQGTTRLVENHDGTPLPPPPPLSDAEVFARLQLRLTATGERTLRVEADRVELLGIDRWIGGTHITPDNTWRWDPIELKLVRSPAR
jgi:hypothetical protein